MSDIIAAILEREPNYDALPAATPVQVRRLIQQCLVKDADKRLPDIANARPAIASAQTDPRKPMFTRRRLAIAGAAVAAAAVPVTFNVGGLREWLLGTPGPRIRSLVVLPLEDLSGAAEQEFLADGFTDALITDLSKIEGLKVISRTSAMQYKGKRKPLPEIARELQVEGVIEGTLQRDGERVQIAVKLIQAATDSPVWAARFDGDFRGALRLQAQVAQAVAHEIRGTIDPAQEARLAARRAVNPQVYEAYLRGMYFLNKSAAADQEKGMEFLKEAVEKDPAEPLAYSGLAIGYTVLGHEREPDAFKLAKAAANRALELGDTMAETHAALAQTSMYWNWDLAGSRQDFERALELNPNFAYARCHYAWYLTIWGHLDDALVEMERAKELDPLTPLYTAYLGYVYGYAGRHHDEVDEARKSLQLSSNFVWGLLVLGQGYAALRRYDEAIAAHKTLADVDSHQKVVLGRTYAVAGQRNEALTIAREVEKNPTTREVYRLGELYAALGERDQAMHWLQRAYSQRESLMPWIGRERVLAPLHSDPRFQSLARRIGTKLFS